LCAGCCHRHHLPPLCTTVVLCGCVPWMCSMDVCSVAQRAGIASVAARLGDAGVTVPRISVGATPSTSVAGGWDGCTEIHPGNYCCLDRQQVWRSLGLHRLTPVHPLHPRRHSQAPPTTAAASLLPTPFPPFPSRHPPPCSLSCCAQAASGSCDLKDVSCYVITHVIGVYPERGSLLIDAGGTALCVGCPPCMSDPRPILSFPKALELSWCFDTCVLLTPCFRGRYQCID
jgi:hypothetical protein